MFLSEDKQAAVLDKHVLVPGGPSCLNFRACESTKSLEAGYITDNTYNQKKCSSWTEDQTRH